MPFLHCASSNVSSSSLHERMHNHTGYICLTFLHCVFSNVSSSCLLQKMHNHRGCISLTFPHCKLSNVSLNRLPERMHSHIDCICLASASHSFQNYPSLLERRKETDAEFSTQHYWCLQGTDRLNFWGFHLIKLKMWKWEFRDLNSIEYRSLGLNLEVLTLLLPGGGHICPPHQIMSNLTM